MGETNLISYLKNPFEDTTSDPRNVMSCSTSLHLDVPGVTKKWRLSSLRGSNKRVCSMSIIYAYEKNSGCTMYVYYLDMEISTCTWMKMHNFIIYMRDTWIEGTKGSLILWRSVCNPNGWTNLQHPGVNCRRCLFPRQVCGWDVQYLSDYDCGPMFPSSWYFMVFDGL